MRKKVIFLKFSVLALPIVGLSGSLVASCSTATNSFENISYASDLVFVKYDGTDSTKLSELKKNFSKMVKDNDEEKVIVIPTSFSTYQYAPITWQWCLNQLYSAFGFKDETLKNNVIYKNLDEYKSNLSSLKSKMPILKNTYETTTSGNTNKVLEEETTEDQTTKYTPESDYNFVVVDAQMSENLALLGFTPSLVTSDWSLKNYNNFTEQKVENISYSSNSEKLQTDKPRVYVDYSESASMRQKVENYKGNYIAFPKVQEKDALSVNSNPNSLKISLTHGWDSVKEFLIEVNNLFRTPLVSDIDTKFNTIISDFNVRVNTLKDMIYKKYNFDKSKNLYVSMWGASSGTESGIGADDFARYGYDTGEIDWMFGNGENSLNFQKAYPYDKTMVYKIIPLGSFNGIGWVEGSGSQMSQLEIQKRFYSSGYLK